MSDDNDGDGVTGDEVDDDGMRTMRTMMMMTTKGTTNGTSKGINGR
jgi:hypothetical protein